MSTRAQNEAKFGTWEDLPGGGRRYRLDVAGRQGWSAENPRDWKIDLKVNVADAEGEASPYQVRVAATGSAESFLVR